MKRPPGWIAVLPVLWVLLGVIALLAIGAMLAPVRAHGDAEWIMKDPRYVDGAGVHCCGPTDCSRAEPGEIRRVEGGWMHVPTGTYLADGQRGIYFSKDADLWRCARSGVLRCLFLPLGV